MSKIEGISVYDTDMETNVKVVKEAVFSSTTGHKRWKFFGITFFKNKYNERIGKVEFLDEDSQTVESIGFNKKKK